MKQLEYIRTDKNGTKIFYDWNCPRCGGAGSSDNWIFTGKTCYACGGTGRREKPAIVKEYTPEYEAKLKAKRAARAAKHQNENPQPSKEELIEKADETRRNMWEYEGFNRDGTGYLYTGNTYRIKQQLKDSGGRWSAFLARWIAPVNLGPIQGVTIEQINAADLCDRYGSLDTKKCWERFVRAID